MAQVFVEQEDPKTWLVTVEDEDGTNTDHSVTVDNGYYKKLTGKGISIEDLLEKSFEFLLEREPKESILGSFDLADIQKYYPEYEEEMKKTTA